MGKIVLKVLNERLEMKVNETVDNVQFGFRKRLGTKNATFMPRTVMERAVEKQKDLFMCFVDFEKAFDRVKHGLLAERLRELGVDLSDLRVLTDLYWEQKAVVWIEDDMSEVSPNLFSLYSQVVMNKLEDAEGIKIGGININNIRYADNTVLISDQRGQKV